MSMKDKKIVVKIILGMVIGFINGFFGGGAGMLVVPTLSHLSKDLEEKESHATSLLVVLPLSVVSAVVYCIKNKGIDVGKCLNIGVGFIVGGIIGSSVILKKINNDVLRIIFGIIIILCGVIQIIK